MSSSSDDTILPPPRRPINSGGLDGDTVLPSQNAPGIHIPGDVIDGRYTVIREIGRGGMGVVYEVLDALTDDRYAVKRLIPFYSSRPDIVKQFWSEGAASMRFTNQSRLFVTTQTVGQDQGLPYIVMQLISHPTLRSLMDKTTGGMPIDSAMPILNGLAISLSELHNMTYIHRDLKPENIFINASTTPVTVLLTDFGLTKDAFTSTATVMKGAGTERYASPEQKKGLPTTSATDIYAFGGIAYEMLTGEQPTYGDSISDYVNGVPQNVVDLLKDCLSARPERRPMDGNSLALALSESTAVRTSDPSKLVVDRPMTSPIVKSPNSSLLPASVQSKFPELAKYIESMCKIPAGSFQMGSISGRHDEKPLHSVTLSSYYMGATPVTVSVWKEYCVATGTALPASPSWGRLDDHSVVNVSWDDIMGVDGRGGFCTWASEIAGGRLTLPTEAQFEYAARGEGAWHEFPWGNTFDDSKIWCSETTRRDSTAPCVRSSNIYCNSFGLTDMSGNIWQWCSDLYAAYGLYSENKPIGPPSSSDSLRCVRGGSWFNNNPLYFRCAFRFRFPPFGRYINVGFRLASGPG
jgi:formylglycine-generating enzyme required for sulfatase activity